MNGDFSGILLLSGLVLAALIVFLFRNLLD